MSVSALLKDARRAAGLTQVQLAHLAQTAQPSIAAYESGVRTPTLKTLERLLGACEHDLCVLARPRVRHGAASLERLAPAIEDELRHGREQDALRMIFGFADDFRGSSRPGRIALLEDEPPTTGDRRFDAALAGTAELFAREAAIPTPGWVDHPTGSSSLGGSCRADAPLTPTCSLTRPPSSRVTESSSLARCSTVPDDRVKRFSRAQIVHALQALGEELTRRGIRGQVFVVGGAAMALCYSTRRVTRDIDAVFEPKASMYEAANKIATELGLPDDWLNDAVAAQDSVVPRRAFRPTAASRRCVGAPIGAMNTDANRQT